MGLCGANSATIGCYKAVKGVDMNKELCGLYISQNSDSGRVQG
jgi:hypothetical protein